MPCDDVKADDSCGTEMHLHIPSEEGHDHPADDGCSPFCSCQCCHTHIVPIELPFNNTFLSESVHQYNFLGSNPMSTFFNFWHPPKLV